MDRNRLKKIAILLTCALVFLAAETTARFFWRNYPPVIQPTDDPIFVPVTAHQTVFALKPGTSFYYQGTSGVLNNHGLRNPKVKIPKPENTVRILMLGDELVFGPGLADADTWPRRLQAVLEKHANGVDVEVINAGVPLYNLARSVGFLQPLAERYKPDVVILVLAENDLEIHGVHATGRRPALFSSIRFEPAGKFPAFGRLLLPDKNAPLRYVVANLSYAYLFTALYLKGSHRMQPQMGPPVGDMAEQYFNIGNFDFPASSCCQAENIIWKSLSERLVEVKSLSEETPFKLSAVLYSDFHLRGRAALRTLESFEKAGIPLLNLSVYRQSEKTEKKRHTLRWAPWPNSTVTKKNASRLAAWLIHNELLPAKENWKQLSTAGRPYDDLLRVRKKMYWDKVNGQEVKDRIARKKFASKIKFSNPATYKTDQLLYGWWPPASLAWLGFPDTAWVSNEASFRLARPPGTNTLHVEGRTFRFSSAVLEPQSVSFHFECLPSDTVYRFRGDLFEVDIPIPESLRRFKQIEISIRAMNPFTPESIGLREDDNRLISIGIDSVELK